MSEGADQTAWHVLDFYSDRDGSCALTVFVEGTRFHIIADISKLTKDTEAGMEYLKLLHTFQASEEGVGDLYHRIKSSEDGSDSGVDVTAKYSGDGEVVDNNPEGTLHIWMVEPLLLNFDQVVKQSQSTERSTLQDWYHGPIRFCELTPSNNGTEIVALELDASTELEDRMQKLLPNMTLPKYITDNANVEYYSASEFDVFSASDQPTGTPYHPARIHNRKTNEGHFLKIVDNQQPGPMKRELNILKRIKQLKLYEGIHVPVLEGLVSFDSAEETSTGKKKIMGFILTDIPDPTPLTLKLTADVSQEKRDAWSKEANRVKEILHDHEIIWGDAKADNFMVDKDENLWIIDFGGSYTEGWVDKELNETEEGDDMGTEKIVNALIDPVANTLDPREEVAVDRDEEGTGSREEPSKKRKRAEPNEEDTRDADDLTAAKAARREDQQ